MKYGSHCGLSGASETGKSPAETGMAPPLLFQSTRDRRSGRKPGSALVLVLVFLALISAVLFRLQSTAMLRLKAADQAVNTAQLRAAQQVGIDRALKILSDDENLLVDHPAEIWAQPVAIEDPLGFRTEIRIIDGERWFDINNLALEVDVEVRPVREVLHDLYRACGDMHPTLRIQALKDWVDANSEGNYEQAWYEKEDPPYRCANAPMMSFEEINLVAEIDTDFYNRLPSDEDELPHPMDTFIALPPLQTTKTRLTRINVNTAPPHVLLGIVGPDQSALVEQFLAFRQQQPIREIGAYLNRLPPGTMDVANAYLDVKSQFYHVEVVTAGQGSKSGHLVTARILVHRDSKGRVEILQWRT